MWEILGLRLGALQSWLMCSASGLLVLTTTQKLTPRSHSPDDVATAQECEDLGADSRQFVSSVCWNRRSHTLLAANSQGTLKLLELE